MSKTRESMDLWRDSFSHIIDCLKWSNVIFGLIECRHTQAASAQPTISYHSDSRISFIFSSVENHTEIRMKWKTTWATRNPEWAGYCKAMVARLKIIGIIFAVK